MKSRSSEPTNSMGMLKLDNAGISQIVLRPSLLEPGQYSCSCPSVIMRFFLMMGQSNLSLESAECKWLLTHPSSFYPGGRVGLASRTYWWRLNCASLAQLWVPLSRLQNKEFPKPAMGVTAPLQTFPVCKCWLLTSPAKVEEMEDVSLHKTGPGPAKSFRLGVL